MSMSNISIFLGMPIGILGFLFLIWRRLREDYTSNKIFSFGFVLSGCLFVGFILGLFLQSKILYPAVFNPSGLWFWFSFVFISLGFVYSFYVIKFQFFETLEAVGLAFLFWLFVVFLINSIIFVDLKLLMFSIFVGVLIAFFYFVDTRYKSFLWYKSGRVGFSGLIIFAIFFLARSVVALINPNMLSFIGRFDAIISAIASFAFFVTLYNLSGI